MSPTEEVEFFDRKAERHARHLQPVDEAVLRRYRNPGTLYPKESCFRMLGNPRGKHILDVGCGEGEDAMILARLGAQVTGLDVSPRSIELARQCAVLNGVADRTRFLCSPLAQASLPEKSFDVIWIDNVLHHVLDDLEPTLRALLAAAKPGARVLCLEPVNLNRTLRKIRFLVPVHTEVTPGERPLEKRDLETLETLIPDLERRHFNFLGRLGRFVIPGFRYEQAPAWRRTLSDLLQAFDRSLLAIPGFEALGGIGLLHGRVNPG
ncbi:MAG TPA: class I SAM-dependent methyltransferase [Myxococcales bacterium]|nr:class I SAM-dependent methyltransferase [Myxococcales bacterium]